MSDSAGTCMSYAEHIVDDVLVRSATVLDR